MQTITFDWSVALFTFLCVCLMAVISNGEGTFSSEGYKHVVLSFRAHWGLCVGELVIFPIFNGLVCPLLTIGPWYILYTLLAVILTLALHKMWWPKDDQYYAPCVIFLHRHSMGNPKKWYKDLSWVGQLHVILAVPQIAVILGYIFTPMPQELVWFFLPLLSAFILFSTVKPYLAVYGVESENLEKRKETVISALVQAGILVLVTYLKLL